MSADPELLEGTGKSDADLTRLERELSQAKAEAKRLKARLKQADALSRSTLQQLEDERGAKRAAKVPTKGRTRKTKGAIVRVFVPDSHGASVDKGAQKAFLADLDFLKPEEIVWIGDHLDCGGFLAQHHTLGFVPETRRTFAEDVAEANAFLDAVAKLCPSSSQTYIEGNHEHRLEKWCIEQGLQKEEDVDFLLKRFGVAAVLNLEGRGIRHVEYGKKYDGLTVPGAIKLGKGKSIATHGSFAGVSAARKMLQRWGCSVFFGHIHRLEAITESNATSGTMGAWAVGLLATQQPYYQATRPTGHTQGYTFQIEQPSGDFIAIQVPIIEGVSYLGALKGKLS